MTKIKAFIITLVLAVAGTATLPVSASAAKPIIISAQSLEQ